ncbi:MAG: 2OG-Fe(II) oxygenase family protein [Acidobacteriota bacterium]
MEKELVKRTVNSIEFFLNPKIVGNGDLERQISDHLINGDLIVIRDALQARFAERMFDCLDQFSNWKVYEGYEEHFHYRHHNIYEDKLFPPDLLWCSEIFGSDSSRSFIQRLSQRDCEGRTTFSASLYLPGDHSLPHDDFLGQQAEHRQIAFVWHLTKNWQSNWGGEFFWCRKGRYVSPSFNSLVLFRVQPTNMHFVTTVSPQATGKRLAISGWWTGKMEAELDETPAGDPSAEERPLVEII